MPEPTPVVITFPDVETFLVMSGIFKVGAEIVVPIKPPIEWFKMVREAEARIDEDGNGNRYRACMKIMADACLGAARHDSR